MVYVQDGLGLGFYPGCRNPGTGKQSLAGRLLHGGKPPASYPFSPDRAVFFLRFINTGRRVLLAAPYHPQKRKPNPPSPFSRPPPRVERG